MKLRNKKTGEIWDIGKVLANDYPCWETLTQVCEDWEDVKEPLIKDEKIRKAVRAWSEANGLDTMPIYYDANYNRFCDDKDFNISIDFYREVEGGLHGGYSYYLAELCGEEE